VNHDIAVEGEVNHINGLLLLVLQQIMAPDVYGTLLRIYINVGVYVGGIAIFSYLLYSFSNLQRRNGAHEG